MSITNLLIRAMQIVDEANLPPALQPIAFRKVLDLLSSSSEAASAAAPSGRSSPSLTASPQEGMEGLVLDRIAKKLGVSTDQVRDVYFLESETLRLAVASSSFSKSVSEGARQIAILLAAGRQAGDLEPEGWTPSAVIRRACEEYGKFDVGNFGKTLSAMGDVFQMKGRGAAREVRMKVPGYERAARLIRELTKESV